MRRARELRIEGCSLKLIAERLVAEDLVPSHKLKGFSGPGRVAGAARFPQGVLALLGCGHAGEEPIWASMGRVKLRQARVRLSISTISVKVR